MHQFAFVMGVGILIDAFIVRSVLVPALIVIFGDAGRWPGCAAHDRGAGGLLRRCTGPAVACQTLRGTLPVRVNTARIALCPKSAVGSNISGQPPAITRIPCSRP